MAKEKYQKLWRMIQPSAGDTIPKHVFPDCLNKLAKLCVIQPASSMSIVPALL